MCQINDVWSTVHNDSSNVRNIIRNKVIDTIDSMHSMSLNAFDLEYKAIVYNKMGVSNPDAFHGKRLTINFVYQHFCLVLLSQELQ